MDTQLNISHQSSSHPSLDGWFALPPIQVLSTSDQWAWDTVSVRNVQLNPAPSMIPSPVRHGYMLIATQSGYDKMTSISSSGRVWKSNNYPQALNFVPPDFMFESQWHGTHQAVFLDLPASLIQDVAKERLRGDVDRLEITPLLNLEDEVLFSLANKLSWGVHEQTVIDVQYAQLITRMLALHLLLHYSNLPPLPIPRAGCLSPAQQQLIVEFIHAHLTEKHLHQQLAALICVSEGHFDKLFSATFHMPPYRYIMKTRIDRAKQLLLTTDLSLTDIAFECGFASQAHMTRCFTKAMGISPGQFRRR